MADKQLICPLCGETRQDGLSDFCSTCGHKGLQEYRGRRQKYYRLNRETIVEKTRQRRINNRYGPSPEYRRFMADRGRKPYKFK